MLHSAISKRLLALALCACLLVCLAPSGMAATPYRYVALGDSIAAGYGLASESQGYVHKLSGMIGASSTINLARSGMSSGDVLALLDDDEAQWAITHANLVTVSAGCADLLGVFLSILREAVPDGNYQAALQDPAKLAAVQAALSSPQAGMAFTAAIQGAAVSLPQIAGAIHQLNPNAKLVFTSGYNPYDGIAIPGAQPFDLGALADPLVASLNQAMAAALPGETIVDLGSLFTAPGAPHCVNAQLLPSPNLDPHPNAAGHGLIAQGIYQKVGASFPAQKVAARAGLTLKKLNVYKKAGGSSKRGELPKGASLILYAWNDQYAKIGYGTGYGYVKLSQIQQFPLLSEPSRRYEVRNKAAVRIGASNKSQKIGTVYPRGQLVCYEMGGKWACIQLGSKMGYVETKHLKKLK